jgi:hypothetical protein
MTYTPEIGRAFWHEFDQRTLRSPTMLPIIASVGLTSTLDAYLDTRRAGTFPTAFLAQIQPHRQAWQAIADVQSNTVHQMLGTDLSDIQHAFEDFGQGTLLDPDPELAAENRSIHMMDGTPPIGFHLWHASIRAIQLLEVGNLAWWEDLNRMVGLAWAIHSFARPQQQSTPNPALSANDLQELRDAWLPLLPDRRDRQFDLRSTGFHPSPKQPAP